MNEHPVYTISVQTVAYGRYFGKIDDRNQRMPVCQTMISAVIGCFIDIEYFDHGTVLIVRSKDTNKKILIICEIFGRFRIFDRDTQEIGTLVIAELPNFAL